jgi:Fe-S-cluster formation regulator IscX/YfhJ
MKLISKTMLSSLRRGAEQMYVKHRERLPDATTVIKQAIAEELGIDHANLDPQAVALSTDEKIGLFDDEDEGKNVKKVTPTAMACVKLVDYIKALQDYQTDEPTINDIGNGTGTGDDFDQQPDP